MSSVDHVISLCGELRTAFGWLSTIPGRTRRNQRALTESATAKRDRRAAEERADRDKLLGAGKLVTGSSAAPVNIAALDAKEKIANDVDHTAWVMASSMRNRGYNDLRQGVYRPDGRSADHRFKTGLDWISMNAPRLQDGDRECINVTYRSLVAARDLAHAVAGEGPDRRPLAGECPSCGRRSLAWDCGSDRYEEWHVVCTNDRCRCQGRDCGCRQPDRTPGSTHVWLEAAWGQLAQQIKEEVP